MRKVENKNHHVSHRCYLLLDGWQSSIHCNIWKHVPARAKRFILIRTTTRWTLSFDKWRATASILDNSSTFSNKQMSVSTVISEIPRDEQPMGYYFAGIHTSRTTKRYSILQTAMKSPWQSTTCGVSTKLRSCNNNMHTWFSVQRFFASPRRTGMEAYDSVPIRFHGRSVPGLRLLPLSDFQKNWVCLPVLQTKMATDFLYQRSVSASSEHKRTTTALLLIYKVKFLSWTYESEFFTVFTRTQQNANSET